MIASGARRRIQKHLLFEPALASLAAHNGQVVGGTLRDAYLGRPSLDLDLSVGGNGEAFARELAARADGRFVAIGRGRWASYRVVLPGGGPPAQADVWDRRGASLAEDLARRDLTVNALAWAPTSPRIEDPLGGLDDLAERTLRMTRSRVFVEDPLRVLRLARFRIQLAGFSIDPATAAAARAAAGNLSKVASERIRVELEVILAARSAADGLAALLAVGAAEPLAALGLTGFGRAAHRSAIERLDRATVRVYAPPPPSGLRYELALLALLASGTTGATPPPAKLVPEKLWRRALELGAARLPTGAPEDAVFLRRWTDAWRTALIAAVVLDADAEPALAGTLARLESLTHERPDLLTPAEPFLDGDAVQRVLGVGPGPEVGAALRRLEAARIEGEIRSREEAVAFLRREHAGGGPVASETAGNETP